jgi:uncharacterized protein YjdB
VKDSTIAVVSAAGVVTARGVGTTQVAASANGKSGIAAVTVVPTPVASVSVLPGQIQLAVGDTARVKALTSDAARNILSGRVVTWASSNQAVATVDTGGLVKAVAPGSATIIATSEGQSGSATVTVSPVAVGSVSVQPAAPSIVTSTSVVLTAVVKDVNGTPVERTVSWTSSNESIATVSANGSVTGVSPGTSTITATTEGKSATTTVTVTAPAVASVVVAPDGVSIIAGQTAALAVTLKDANGATIPLVGRTVAWSSSDRRIATVSAAGAVTAVSPGTATITALSEGKSGAATVNVAAVPVGSVAVSPTTVALFVGQSATLTPTVRDANGAIVTDRAVAWASSDRSVAMVSPSGAVTAVGPGTDTITAISEGKLASTVVTVSRVPVGALVIPSLGRVLRIGQTALLSDTVKDANGVVVTDRSVVWTSNNPAIATVSDGVVTATAPGTATIVATSEGKSGSTVVTVTTVPVGSVTVTPAAGPFRVGQSAPLASIVKDSAGVVVTDRLVTWTSSDNTIARVSSAGLVTAVGPGAATITATSEGKSGSATVTVQVPVAAIVLRPDSVAIDVGDHAALTATTKAADGGVLPGRAVTYRSGNEQIAIVSSVGDVIGRGYGTAMITATSEGVSATSRIVVQRKVVSVDVSPTILVITRGVMTPLHAVVKDASGTDISGRDTVWTSSDTSIATISSVGLLTAKKAGTVTITATVDGVSGSETIRVANPRDGDDGEDENQ